MLETIEVIGIVVSMATVIGVILASSLWAADAAIDFVCAPCAAHLLRVLARLMPAIAAGAIFVMMFGR